MDEILTTVCDVVSRFVGSPRHAFVAAFTLGTVGLLTSCDGGGNGTETVMLRLSTNADCYGLSIDVDAPATDAVCTAASALSAAGCSAAILADDEHLALSASGCFAADGTALFQCTVPSLLAGAIRHTAEVRCGCGCSDTCPAAPTISVCDTDEDCSVVAARQPATTHREPALQRTVTRSSQFTSTSVSTTYCGTCCDVYYDSTIRLDSDDDIHELNFDAHLGDCSADCEFADDFGGPMQITYAGGDAIHICIASPTGFSAPLDLLNCHNEGAAYVVDRDSVKALGSDLREVSPPPAVNNHEQY